MIKKEYLYGEMKMVNLNNFMMSLKCSWTQRVVEGGQSCISTFKAVFFIKSKTNKINFFFNSLCETKYFPMFI